MATTDHQQLGSSSYVGQGREPRVDERRVQHSGMAAATRESGVRQKISDDRPDPWRTFQPNDAGVAGWFWNVESDRGRSLITRLLCPLAQSARQLRSGG